VAGVGLAAGLVAAGGIDPGARDGNFLTVSLAVFDADEPIAMLKMEIGCVDVKQEKWSQKLRNSLRSRSPVVINELVLQPQLWLVISSRHLLIFL
jgi:hypothetical protein